MYRFISLCFIWGCICCCFWSLPAKALVLEYMIQEQTLEETLSNKTVGYYIGSFDPLHRGHEEMAQLPVKKGLCDYVLIYPSWGGDSYKANRTDVNIRLDMLFGVFADHPTVIVTRLAPQELQRALTTLNPQRMIDDKHTVKPAFSGLRFIGIIGSDTTLAVGLNKEALRSFMSGMQVSDKYARQTLEGCMALPVESFVVGLRAGDDLAPLQGFVGDKRIIATLQSDAEQGTSSTAIKAAVKKGDPIEGVVSNTVAGIIREHGLYQ